MRRLRRAKEDVPTALCFTCLTETCSHKAKPGKRLKHPDPHAQVPATTMAYGTSLCTPCAIGMAARALQERK